MGSFATNAVAVRDRYDYWTSLVAQAFVELEVEPAPRVEINCRLSWREIGSTRLMFVQGTPQSVQRTSGSIASDHAQHIILMFQKRGHGCLLHQGKSVQLKPGDIVAMDTRSPYRLTFFSPFEQEILRFPVRVLGSAMWDTASVTAAHLNPSFASRLLSDSFNLAKSERFELSSSLEAPLLELATLALCSPLLPHADRSATNILGMARAYIRAHAAAPELCPQQVAQGLGISVRSLQKVFAAVGEHPSACILDERLVRAAALLRTAGANDRSVWEIGQRCGFKDPSHFSRAFRKRYGVTPREWRFASSQSSCA